VAGHGQELKVIETLHAKQAIRDLVVQYCRAIDRRDFELLAELYAPGSIDDYGARV
jgi:hypothetical protein